MYTLPSIKIQARLASFKQLLLAFARLLERFVSSKLFRRLIFVWFIFQAIWMALSTRFGIPPDEIYHFSLIKLFSENGWFPFIHNQQGMYFLGEVIHTPFFLYHYLMSLPFHLFGDSGHAVIYLRFINIGMGVGSLYLVGKLADRLKFSSLVKNLSLFMLANTLMFVFLSASINYDNLFILLSLASFILALKLLDEFKASTFLLFLAIFIGGLLTKVNYLPVAFALAVILFVKYFKNLHSLWKIFLATWSKNRWLNYTSLSIVVVVSLLLLQRYAGNIVEYHNYSPSCTQVNTVAQCEQNSIYQRAQGYNRQPSPHVNTNIIEYTPSWVTMMLSRTYGILAHKSADATKFIKIWSEILTCLGLFALIRKYTRGDRSINIVLGMAVFYTIVLLVMNFRTYEHRGIMVLAVQGRYLFAVLPVFYLLSNFYIWKLLKKTYLRIVYIVITLIVFATASLPSYLLKTTPDWYTVKTAHINSSLHAQIEKTIGKP